MWDEERDLLGEGAGVLWKWWEWVGSGEFMVDLGLIKDGQLEYVIRYAMTDRHVSFGWD